MLDLHYPKQAYEIFRLQWMIDHGYSVLDLLKNLEAMIEKIKMSLVYEPVLRAYSRTGNSALALMVLSGHAMKNSCSTTIP